MVDHRERGKAERIIGLKLRNFDGVFDRLLGMGEISVELGEHSVPDRERWIKCNRLLQDGHGPFLVSLVTEIGGLVVEFIRRWHGFHSCPTMVFRVSHHSKTTAGEAEDSRWRGLSHKMATMQSLVVLPGGIR